MAKSEDTKNIVDREKSPDMEGSASCDVVELKRSMGLPNAVAVSVGIIVGSGIFVSPTGVLELTGSSGGALFVWAACGLLGLIGAQCYAELGTTVTKSGSDYAYIMWAWGPLPAFLYLWSCLLIIMPVTNVITALTFSRYLLQPMISCIAPTISVRLIAACCILLLTFINGLSVKAANRVQIIFTLTKILAILLIILVGVVRLCQGHTQNMSNMFENSSSSPGDYALAVYQGLYAYAGWNYLNFMTEELRNPFKTLPRAIWLSMPFITLIYVLANISYFVVLPVPVMLSSQAVAVTFGEQTFDAMAWIMSIFVACSTFGALNGAILTSSRLFFVGAREGQLPDVLALVNVNYFTPISALAFECILSLINLWTDDVNQLITFGTFAEILAVTMSIGGLLYKRIREPDMPRPIKSSLVFPIVFVVVCLFLIIVPLTESSECLWSLAVIASGVPVYLVCVVWKNKPVVVTQNMGKLTRFVQSLTTSAMTDPKYD